MKATELHTFKKSCQTLMITDYNFLAIYMYQTE